FISVGFVAVSIFYNVRSFYFIGIAFFMLVILEYFLGKINGLVLFLIVFMSPLFEQLSLVLGFPIRLFLSEMAGYILNMMGMEIQVEGNLMKLNGRNFSVDDACMGLNMLSISFIMGVFLLSHHFRLFQRKLNILPLGLYFMGIFSLGLVSNLLRILFLVIFNVMPENPLHELIGVGCLLSYVMLPMYFFSKWLVWYWGKPLVNNSITHSRIGTGYVLLLTLLALNIMVSGFLMKNKREQFILEHAKVELWNLKPIQLKSGITKLSNKEILVYIKPIPEFISGEHSPLMCWKGSGYEFKSIKKVNVGATEIFTGKLNKAGSTLCTAWWYSNGKFNTINQL
ncbi:MAG: exosortase N, partial [Cytophagales bacterium]|nr:exosortase N [Cytophagales bacterium]